MILHTHLPYRHVDYDDGRLVSELRCLSCGETLRNAARPLVEEVRKEIARRARARTEARMDAAVWPTPRRTHERTGGQW